MENTALYVPAGTKAAYEVADVWKDFGEIVEMTDIAEGLFYLQNVETGLYLNNGNMWGTHTVLADEGLPVEFTKQEDGSYTICIPDHNYDGNDGQLFVDGNAFGVFVDYWGRGCPYFIITKAGNDTYHIQSQLYGDATQYFGNNPTKEAYDRWGEPLGVYNDLDCNVANAEGMNITWRLVPTSLDELRQTISLMEGLGGYSLDEAKAVGSDATQQQIDDAISGLTAQVLERMAYATASQPVDATPLLRNYSFSYNKSHYWEGSTPQFESYNNAEFFQTGFDVHQTITDLPDGNYMLRMKGYHRPGNDQVDFTQYKEGNNNASAQLYANDEYIVLRHQATGARDNYDLGGLEVTYGGQSWWVPNSMEEARRWFDAEEGYYQNELPVTVTGGTLTIGVRLDEGAPQGWVCFDDFRLEYLGPDANQLYVAESPSVIAGSKAELSISLKNNVAVNMTDFYLQLPEGMTIANNNVTIAADRAANHVVSAVWFEDGGYYHIVSFSSQNNAFKKNNGTLFTMMIECDESVAPGNHEAKVMTVVMSDTEKNKLSQADFTFTIEVPDLKMGDVNGDTNVNGLDIVEMVDHIMQRPSDTFHAEAADLYYDKKINGLDLVKLINLVLSQPISQSASARSIAPTTFCPWLEAEGDALTMNIDAAGDYILAQCVVELDGDMQLRNVTTDGSHTAAWQRISEHHYAVVVYSTKNDVFSDGETLLTLDCTGSGNAKVSNIMLVDTERNERHFAAAQSHMTGIDATEVGEQQGERYDLQGRKVGQRQQQKGIYIINGKKTVIK